ncbi:MAG: hypothetical protein ACLPKI_23485 [Streptosporangiaceae bacterium]
MTASDVSARPAAQTPAPSPGRTARAIDWPALRQASRSCCCVARPAVIVVLRPAESRPHSTELLLCRHHFDRSRPALLASRALAFSLDGQRLPVTPSQDADVTG